MGAKEKKKKEFMKGLPTHMLMVNAACFFLGFAE